ncbi:MAG: hypothetical protein Fur003_2820 [Candidatus Dojkabacteria bacterium]
MNQLTNWLTDYGVTREILLYLLFIPVIATIINISRYVIGMKAFGIYAPMILAFAYIFTGIRFGLLITVAVILATLLSYRLLRGIRMHYLSRIAVNYFIISIFIILVIALNEISPIQVTNRYYDLGTVPPLGIILIATLSDFFIKQYVKSSFLTTFRSLIETMIIGIIGWAVLRIEFIGDFLLSNVWIMLPLFLINIMIGQYTGLRLKDFSRFKRVIRNS